MQPTWGLLKYLISTVGSQGLLVLLNQILTIEARPARDLPHDVVEYDHQETISGRTARRMEIFHSMVSSSCEISLNLNVKFRYSGRMWAGEGSRGHGVPMQGTAGEGQYIEWLP